ncbi:Uncharacterized conserved protein YndB, AHSA1/START domain [Oceanobacillus limi]|uniref:Uncharacterized conserved protein YndB, AHSA1/START domain n=1 Tax=Oceanobacillus limi TaxID=930131 RepID=A0A1H9Y5C3_9BACI|nr:SRPBCC domain-containing protein [Oceanobacillus limi]SES63579.1 Uncharacterized conserved protein YndB, AHSA1/START domain [Oceanobacillus limi]
MNNYGKLEKNEGRYVLVFERPYPFNPEEVFRVLTNPDFFTQWYPFATGEMDLRVGGKIQFDDGEGSEYEAVITDITPPYSFCFQEVDDLLEMTIEKADQGSLFTFKHTFDDQSMAMYVAAGWHRCLNVLGQLIHGQPVAWEDNASELREYYKEAFHH